MIELKNTGVLAWVADSDTDSECICVGGKNDTGYSVNLYYDEDGGIVGGLVFDAAATAPTAGFGRVPYTSAVDA